MGNFIWICESQDAMPRKFVSSKKNVKPTINFKR